MEGVLKGVLIPLSHLLFPPPLPFFFPLPPLALDDWPQLPRLILTQSPPASFLFLLLQTPGASRDILLLDIALDDWFRVLLERTPASSLAKDDALACVAMVLQNTLVAVDSEDLQQVGSGWGGCSDGGECT
jgi:hypothetical protein